MAHFFRHFCGLERYESSTHARINAICLGPLSCRRLPPRPQRRKDSEGIDAHVHQAPSASPAERPADAEASRWSAFRLLPPDDQRPEDRPQGERTFGDIGLVRIQKEKPCAFCVCWKETLRFL